MDEHARAVPERIRVNLERVESVLERDFGTRSRRELARLARRYETRAEFPRERSTEDEPARLSGDD